MMISSKKASFGAAEDHFCPKASSANPKTLPADYHSEDICSRISAGGWRNTTAMASDSMVSPVCSPTLLQQVILVFFL